MSEPHGNQAPSRWLGRLQMLARAGDWVVVYSPQGVCELAGMTPDAWAGFGVEIVGEIPRDPMPEDQRPSRWRHFYGLAPDVCVLVGKAPFGLIFQAPANGVQRGKHLVVAHQVRANRTPVALEVGAFNPVRVGEGALATRVEWVRLVELELRLGGSIDTATLVHRYFAFTSFRDPPHVKLRFGANPRALRDCGHQFPPIRLFTAEEALVAIALAHPARVWVRADWAYSVLRLHRLGYQGSASPS